MVTGGTSEEQGAEGHSQMSQTRVEDEVEVVGMTAGRRESRWGRIF